MITWCLCFWRFAQSFLQHYIFNVFVSCNCNFWWNIIMYLRSSFQSVKWAYAWEVNDWPLHCTGWPTTMMVVKIIAKLSMYQPYCIAQDSYTDFLSLWYINRTYLVNKDVKGKEPTAENPVSQINKDKERSGELDLSRDMYSLAELSVWNLPLELSKSVEKSQTAQACVLTTRSTCVLTTRSTCVLITRSRATT